MYWLVSAFKGFKQSSNNQWDVTSVYGSKGRIRGNLQMCWWMPKVQYINKSCHVTQVSDSLIIQLNIFKYIDGISKKFIPNLSIDEEISLWGNRMVLSGVIYHEGEQSHCGHYTSGVNVNNTWFLISDTIILREQKLQCNSRYTSVPYILIYKKKFFSCSSTKFIKCYHRR